MMNNDEKQLEDIIKESQLPVDKINTLIDFVQKNINCDSKCQKEREIERLRKEWQTSEKKLKSLPSNVKENEKKYYLADKGKHYYDNVILKGQYTDAINKWRENELIEYSEAKEIQETLIQNYESETISDARLTQLYNDVKKKNEQLKQDLDDYYRDTYTNERRVWYQTEDNEGLDSWKFYIKIVYYVVAVVYIVFGGFIENRDYKKISIWIVLILYLLFPFIIPYVLSFFLDQYNYYQDKAPE